MPGQEVTGLLALIWSYRVAEMRKQKIDTQNTTQQGAQCAVGDQPEQSEGSIVHKRKLRTLAYMVR